MTILVSRNVPTARALARVSGIPRRSPYDERVPSSGKAINWGLSDMLDVDGRIVNPPQAVALASSKTLTFKHLAQADVRTVPFTFDADEALAWHAKNKTVYVRTLSRSHGGKGILLVRPEDEWPTSMAKLFTRFVKCDYEARIHVAGGVVIDFAQKKRRKVETPPKDRYWIRNHGNGWVFARQGVEMPEFVKEMGIKAVSALGLDFGAVDMLVRKDKCYVLEVNTAPGLTGHTLVRYSDYFRSI